MLLSELVIRKTVEARIMTMKQQNQTSALVSRTIRSLLLELDSKAMSSPLPDPPA